MYVRSLSRLSLSDSQSVEPRSLSCVMSGSNIGLEESLKNMAKILKWAAVNVVTAKKSRLYPVKIMTRLYWKGSIYPQDLIKGGVCGFGR